MFDEFVQEVFFIKIKIKSHLENIKENTGETIETFGIKNKNSITYHNNDTIHKLIIKNNKIIMIRENNEFTHTFNFELKKETKSEYYIKEYLTSIELMILTTKLLISDNRIEIIYKVLDSNEEYKYMIDLE